MKLVTRSWGKVSNFILIFVCTGNICRSPMAEGIMKELILDKYETHKQVMPIEILSAGTHSVHRSPASGFAIEVADNHGINLKFHRSRQISEGIIKAADLILTMERNNTDYIKQRWSYIDYIYELKSFQRDENNIEDSIDIIDPIGMDIDVYKGVFDELQKEIVRVSEKVFSLALEKYRAR